VPILPYGTRFIYNIKTIQKVSTYINIYRETGCGLEEIE
jgi:hypothetical protein